MTRGTRYVVYTGALIPLVFWGTLAICALRLGGYNHAVNLVSELGAAGTQTRVAFASGLLFCAVLSIVFAAGIHRECRHYRVSSSPALMILFYAFSIAGAAVFPMPHRLHGILGMPAILVILSPLLACFLWRKVPRLKRLLLVSAISSVIMALGFLVFVPEILPGLFGLKQRFFHIGWSIWFVYLSFGFAGVLDPRRNSRLGVSIASGGPGSA